MKAQANQSSKGTTFLNEMQQSTDTDTITSTPISPSGHSTASSADFGAFVEADNDLGQAEDDRELGIGSSDSQQPAQPSADLEGQLHSSTPAARSAEMEGGIGKWNSNSRDGNIKSSSQAHPQSIQDRGSAVASNQKLHQVHLESTSSSTDDSNEWGEWGQSQNTSTFSPMDDTFETESANDNHSQSKPSIFQSQPQPQSLHSDSTKHSSLEPSSQTDWDAWLINSNPNSTANSNQTSRATTPLSRLNSSSNPTPNAGSSSNSRIFSRGTATDIGSSASASTSSRNNAFDDLLPPGFTLPPPPSASEIPDPPSSHQNQSSKKSSTTSRSRDLLSDDDNQFASFDPNQDFFQAFSKATSLSNPTGFQGAGAGPPSPPIIDLRETERKLDKAREKQRQLEGGGGSSTKEEEDFFSSFEKSPSELMKSVGRNNSFKSNPSLEGETLENLGEAQSSPLEVPKVRNSGGDYFEDQVGDSPSNTSNNSRNGSWSGSLRKTWSSLKGSLPSASDFLVMEDGEGGEWNPSTSPIQNQTSEFNEKIGNITDRRGSNYSNNSNNSGRSNSKSPQPQSRTETQTETPTKKPIQRLAHASDYNGDLSKPSSRKNSSLHGPISGAPGFSYDSTPHWNTGSWTLEDSPPASNLNFSNHSPSSSNLSSNHNTRSREIKVTLSDRREETSEVITQFHSSRIQSNLPPRLQLGRNWKLLYSMDQHGISLSTLYQKVNLALDPSKARKVGNEYDRSGLMLGASKEAMASLGLDSNGNNSIKSQFSKPRVGGGLDLKDAGLVIAVKDGDENVFGAFVNERLRPQSSYYGSGEW